VANPYGDLTLLYASTIFGSPRDVTLDEIATGTLSPADAPTAHILRFLAGRAAMSTRRRLRCDRYAT